MVRYRNSLLVSTARKTAVGEKIESPDIVSGKSAFIFEYIFPTEIVL